MVAPGNMAAARLLPILGFLVLALAATGRAQVLVEGAKGVSRKKVEAALDLPERPLEMDSSDWEVWTEDAAGILSDLYRESGYFDAAFRFERVPGPGRVLPGAGQAEPGSGRPEPGSGRAQAGAPAEARASVRVSVREGERYRFGHVSVTSREGTAEAADPGDLSCRPGRAFEQNLIFKDRRVLLNAWGDAGFLRAAVQEEIVPDTAAKTVAVHFTMEPGPAVVFDTLIIRNLREGDSTGVRGVTRPGLLRALAEMRRGDTVTQDGLAAYEGKLRSTRVFNYVRLRDSLRADGRSAMILSTEERIPGEMDFTAFYETQYGPGVGMNWVHGNMFGMLHEGRLGGSLAQKRQNAYLGYASPLFFGTPFRFDYELTANWYQDGRLQEGAGLYRGDFDIVNSGKVSRSLADWCRLVASTELRGLEYKTDVEDTTRDFTLNFISSMYFNLVDDAAGSSQGLRLAVTWGNGGQVFKRGEIQVPTDGRHNWLELETAFYLPLQERVKLAFRLDGGRFFGAGGTNSDRFFLGGPRSVRSFGWRELCPDRDDATGVCRTEGLEPAYFLTSLELRTSPFSPGYISPEGRLRHLLDLQVVPFVDFGNVWEAGRPLTRDGEGKAFGLGLRYSLLNIFNVRLDFATDGPDFDNWQWIVDLAQAF